MASRRFLDLQWMQAACLLCCSVVAITRLRKTRVCISAECRWFGGLFSEVLRIYTIWLPRRSPNYPNHPFGAASLRPPSCAASMLAWLSASVLCCHGPPAAPNANLRLGFGFEWQHSSFCAHISTQGKCPCSTHANEHISNCIKVDSITLPIVSG